MKLEGIVLAGGLGTRLRDAVPGLPKPMAPVAGRPFLAWLLDFLQAEGFARVVLSTGYMAEAISACFGARHGDIAIEYAVEASPLGTGGATLAASNRCPGNPFFVINGDTFLAHDYRAMLARHQSAGAQFTMAVRSVGDVSRYGRVVLDGDRPVSLDEKSAVGPGWVNAGVYLLDRRFLSDLDPDQPCSLERDIIAPRLATHDCLACASNGYFIDIGVPAEYQRAQVELPAAVRAGRDAGDDAAPPRA